MSEGTRAVRPWEIEGVAVVTGAGRGIGAAVARRLAERGAQVVVADVRAELAQETAAAIVAAGLAAHAEVVDVTEPGSVERLADAAAARGRLAAWVNNAGAIERAPLLEIEPESFDRLMRVNARGCLLGVQSAARRMDGGASIVNLASMSSAIALPANAHYGATKGAVAALTRHAAIDLAERGIRVNAVAPGSIRTAFNEDRFRDPAILARMEARVPLGRIGVPDDVAGPVAFLCSDEARYMTGAVVAVDGGWTAW